MTVKLETVKEHQARLKKQWGDKLQCARGNVQRELKAAFPGVKFGIKTSRFSNGDDLRIEWTDGPTEEQVQRIVGKYRGGSFDGMIDLYEYNTGTAREFTDTYGSAKYVFAERHYSREALEEVASKVGNYWKCPMPAIVDNGDGTAYVETEGFNVSTRDNTWDCNWMARQVIYRTIKPLTAAEIAGLNKPVPDYSTAANGYEIPM